MLDRIQWAVWHFVNVSGYISLMINWHPLILFTLGVSLFSPAQAGEFDAAYAAHDRGDFQTAFRLWKPLAEQGKADAQYNIGVMYNRGHGVPQNYLEAMRWYRLSAEKGHASAQYNLGVMYKNGDGILKDYKEAAKWFKSAAVQGDAEAQFGLGKMFAEGEGAPQDIVQAHAWMNLASSNGKGIAAKKRDQIAKEMTLDEISEAQALAREWQMKFNTD